VLYQVPAFASGRDCRTVIATYERCRHAHGAVVGDPFFDRRVLWIGSFPERENETRRILQDWRTRATLAVSLNAGRRLYSDTIQVVRWDGQEMPPHYDDRHPDGSAHRSPWREWAGVIYLNDDYAGGDLWFPSLGATYKPVAGTFVFFQGSLLHGVRKTTSGLRYTSPSWYTSDRSREDPVAGVEY
jgi:predicted 2-oxoglutarate/Fe(II)-dependent dioxygenase YbiX